MKRNLCWSYSAETQEGGWTLIGFPPHFDPVWGFPTHDVFDHGKHESGSVVEELIALGRMIFRKCRSKKFRDNDYIYLYEDFCDLFLRPDSFLLRAPESGIVWNSDWMPLPTVLTSFQKQYPEFIVSFQSWLDLAQSWICYGYSLASKHPVLSRLNPATLFMLKDKVLDLQQDLIQTGESKILFRLFINADDVLHFYQKSTFYMPYNIRIPRFLEKH